MNTLVIFSFLFAFSELMLMLVKRSRSGKFKTRCDNGSLILLWLIITVGFTAGFFLARPISQFWLGFGSGLIIGGLIIRWISILQLGKSFTVDVAITDSAELKTDGIYERLRHPSYLGILMIMAGFSAAMNSIFSFLVMVVPVFIAIIYRINTEEELLIREFGTAYKNYISSTKRLFPGIY
jgi:protein-S-isoprenylcysteine O-methyltransferase Ste14